MKTIFVKKKVIVSLEEDFSKHSLRKRLSDYIKNLIERNSNGNPKAIVKVIHRTIRDPANLILDCVLFIEIRIENIHPDEDLSIYNNIIEASIKQAIDLTPLGVYKTNIEFVREDKNDK